MPLTIQPSLHDSLLSFALRASSTNSIREWLLHTAHLLTFVAHLLTSVVHLLTSVAHLLTSVYVCRYFNYRTTKFLTQEGFYQFHNWFDDRAWYPLGRIIGGTIYPGEWGTLNMCVCVCSDQCVCTAYD